MPAVMPCSPWSGLPGKMISTRPISPLRPVPDSGPEKPVTSNKIAGMNGGRGAGTASIRRNGKAHTITKKPVLGPDGIGGVARSAADRAWIA